MQEYWLASGSVQCGSQGAFMFVNDWDCKQSPTISFTCISFYFLIPLPPFLFRLQGPASHLFWWWIYLPLTTIHSMILLSLSPFPLLLLLFSWLLPAIQFRLLSNSRDKQSPMIHHLQVESPHWCRRQPDIHILASLALLSPSPII